MKKLLLLNIFVHAAIISFAQNGFTAYQDSTISLDYRNFIKIDLAGNKWVGTKKGVHKFDGISWTVYDTSNSTIPSNTINDIAFDAAGNGWFATNAGIAKFDGNTWTTYSTSNSGLPSNQVNCLSTEGSTVWIGTQFGLVRFNTIKWITYNSANSGITDNYVTAINVDSNGDVWVGTKTGLCVKKLSSWISYNEKNSNFVTDQVKCIYIENAATAWVGTNSFGLFKFENGIAYPYKSFFEEKEGLISLQINNYPSFSINTISKGPQGGVLIRGVRGAGSWQQPPPIDGFYEILNENLYFYSFPSSYVSFYHVFENSTNKVWFLNNKLGGINKVICSFDYASFSGTIPVQNNPDLAFLDVNQVRANIMNRGDMHWNLNAGGYEVPKKSGRNAVFASALWMGGLDNGGSLHQAAMTYRQTGIDYWPGPLDTITAATDSVTSFNYDKIWKLDRWQIDEFRTMFANGSVAAGAYTPAANIINWPAQGTGAFSRNLAPFVDVNGDGLYNPMLDGDYPKIKGDQMCYWIFNDNLKPHTETGALPIKAEIHASAYAYNCDNINDSLKALNYTTFYDYEIYNRSALNYTQTYLSLWQDFDMGGYQDDYTGCNPSQNYTFVYNGDTVDEGVSGVLGYGANPPMYSNVLLNGPSAEPNDGIDNDNDGIVDEAGEKNLMTNVLNYNNSSSPKNGNPNNAMDFYNYMQNKWQDSTQTTYGGYGTDAGTPYNFMYDGVPALPGWSGATLNNPYVDGRINMNCGPFNLNANAHVNFSFAIVYTRDDQPAYDLLHLYNKNLADVKQIQQWYAADNFPSCSAVSTGIKDQQPLQSSLTLYPNPGTDILFVDYKSVSKDAVLEMFNVRGQLLKQLKINSSAKQSISIADLSTGLYLLKVSDGKTINTQRFIKQ